MGYWLTSKVNDPRKFLPWPADFIDNTWDVTEREAVAIYLDKAPDIKFWKGWSVCRLCGKNINGSTDKSDGIYVWPAGLSHYVREHNVKPPKEFINHAFGKEIQAIKQKAINYHYPALYPLPDWVAEGVRAKVIMAHNDEYFPVGSVVTIYSFVEENINILKENGDMWHYLRGDFVDLFGPISE
jgi:hypothetical protein